MYLLHVLTQTLLTVQDSTFITATNVKFLVKSPIVGIKNFEGDKLKKRLQITFESEGSFNLFANKTRQWLGVNMNSSVAESTPSNSQFAPPMESSQMPVVVEEPEPDSQPMMSQQVGSQIMSQFVSQPVASQLTGSQAVASQHLGSQTLGSQNNISQHMTYGNQPSINVLQPRSEHMMAQINNDPLSLLVNAIDTKNEDWTQCSQQDTLMNTTQLGYHDTLQTSMYFNNVPQNKGYRVERYEKPEINADCIKEALADTSYVPKVSKKKHRRKDRKGFSEDKFEIAIANAILEIVQNKDESLLDLNDQQLALQMARVLRSRNFLRLVTRVESLLQAVAKGDA